MKNPFVTHSPIHEANDRNSVEEDEKDILESTEQRPQHHGERADTFAFDKCDKEEDGEEHEERMGKDIDEIASTIMQMIDAVDADENSKIKTICIEIGLE